MKTCESLPSAETRADESAGKIAPKSSFQVSSRIGSLPDTAIRIGRDHVKAIADRAAAAARMEARPALALGIFSIIFLLVTLAHAKRRFWFDELFTFYISRLPTLSDVWAALMDGVDFNPPLLYLTTRFSHQMFGVSQMTTRLPEILGFLVMCFSLFVFVRRRCGLLFGFAAMWFPLITIAYTYSAEARPHGLVLGFCALAMVSWQKATEGGRRGVALAVMSLSIAGFVMSHCYSVLILIAFGAAELIRLLTRRKPDWPLWACITAPLVSGLVYLPMLHQVNKYAMNSIAFKSSLFLVPRFYSFLFNDQGGGAYERMIWHETIWPLLAVLAIAALAKPDARATAQKENLAAIPIYELVFLAVLSLLPVFGQALAVFAKAPYNDRYALSAVIGIGALLAMFVYQVTAGDRRVAVAMAFVFGSWFATDFGTWFYSLYQQQPWDLPTLSLSSLPNDTLIVISDPLMFMEADYYEPPEVAARFRFLTDPSTAVRYTGTDMFDRGFYKMKRSLPVKGRVVDYSEFLSSTKHFTVYGPFSDPEDWLFRKLTASGAVTKLRGQSRYPATHGDRCMLLDVETAGTGVNLQ